MGTAICMNASCGVTTSNDGKSGWPLRSGGFALLCHKCGSAYESLIFCDTFHLEETGWRDCSLCGRHIHCGCIASKSLFECLDYGGVGCITCMKGSQFHLIQRGEVPNGFGALMTMENVGDFQSTSVENSVNGDIGDENLLQLCKIVEDNGNRLLSPSRRVDISASLGQSITENIRSTFGEAGTRSSNVIQSSLKSSPYENPESNKFFTEVKNIEESLAQPSLSMNLGAPSALHNMVLPFSCGAVEAREQGKVPYPFQQSQRSRPLLPKPLKSSVTPTNSDANKTTIRHLRIARPPAEGRGKNQLLPRYWPRITDQELEQLSGDLNSTIVPLFEKVLSASDAGRIGRLVLPKACAEAYFPHISQSEGLPIRIQDVKGNEWTFQFRFWPNNNSRMYVLEGVTPCIQSMQLQAGDTVIFSRIDPEGKLVMGFRKATNSIDLQRSYTHDGQTLVLANGSQFGEPSFSSIMDNLQTEDGDLHKLENHGDSTNDNQLQQQMPVVEKKRARNIGPKNKRLLMHSEDALELRLTWEEAQDLLRPPPRAKPSIVTIEDHDFEEYDEPPIFGKRTIFTADSSKSQEQWAKCDDCSKWRKLPFHVLLPSKWTCLDNIWDSNRCSCSEPEEINPKELHNLLRAKKDHTKRRIVEKQEPSLEVEASGLDALASAAVLGEDYVGNLLEPEVGATTKHPRHRAGCSCIVCIQPPSGKGKHKTSCTCNVCLTVKRRFKTLMLRKKKRQSERKSEKEVSGDDGVCRDAGVQANEPDNQERQSRMDGDAGENSNGKIDLNCDPDGEEAIAGSSLVQSDSLPSDRIERHNAVSGLIGEEDFMVRLSSGQSVP